MTARRTTSIAKEINYCKKSAHFTHNYKTIRQTRKRDLNISVIDRLVVTGERCQLQRLPVSVWPSIGTKG
jgi:hypothetical protein